MCHTEMLMLLRIANLRSSFGQVRITILIAAFGETNCKHFVICCCCCCCCATDNSKRVIIKYLLLTRHFGTKRSCQLGPYNKKKNNKSNSNNRNRNNNKRRRLLKSHKKLRLIAIIHCEAKQTTQNTK